MFNITTNPECVQPIFLILLLNCLALALSMTKWENTVKPRCSNQIAEFSFSQSRRTKYKTKHRKQRTKHNLPFTKQPSSLRTNKPLPSTNNHFCLKRMEDGLSSTQEPLLSRERRDSSLGKFDGEQDEQLKSEEIHELPPGGIFQLKPSLWVILPSCILSSIILVGLIPILPNLILEWFPNCAPKVPSEAADVPNSANNDSCV